MGLKERFEKIKAREQLVEKKQDDSSIKHEQKRQLFDLKTSIHRKLIEQLDLDNLGKLKDENESRALVRELVATIIEKEKLPISGLERNYLIEQIEHETFGLGPLEPLVADTTIDEILVNGPHRVFVERFGKLEQTNVIFKDDNHLRQIIDRIVSRIGRRIDESSPMVDARLKDGSRVNAIIPPLAIDGSSLSIRKFKKDPLRADDLIRLGSLTKEIITLMEIAVKGKLNLLISGGTGTGKTTLLNILSSFIPDSERILTIEDAAELQLQQSHVVRLETRPPNIEGKGQVTQRELVKNSLRMRPDRIIVGEVRGGEALDMLQAMNTGHEGSLTTVHANSPRDALARIETMVMFSESNLSHQALNRQIANAFHLVMQITRYSDGVRRISSISEITGMEGDVITMQEIVTFKQTGIGHQKNIEGHFQFTGVKPQFLQRFKAEGILDSMKLESNFLKDIY
jgi:pilus assembly protein CpaF